MLEVGANNLAMENMNNNNNEYDNEVTRKEEGGEAKEAMKKGSWTTTEDAMLREYVRNYGEGNWSSVQMKTGLTRCGKSCRLRWTNHLRPNLKKSAFSQEEEQIIIYLHSQFGNKWARMAAQLPGRTDNEIKNFWNTRIKRCERDGLPIYPPELQAYQQQHNHYYAPTQYPPSSLSFSSLPASSSYPRFKVPNENSGGMGNGNLFLPLFPDSPLSHYGTSTPSMFDQNFVANSSHAGGVDGLVGPSSLNMTNSCYSEVAPLVSPHGNSGLLDDVVKECQHLSHNNESKSEDSTTATKLSEKRKRVDSNSSQFSTGKELVPEDNLEGMNSMDDDDFFNLVNNFSLEMSVPEWYHKGERD